MNPDDKNFLKDFEQRVRRRMEGACAVPAGSRVIVAVSGGADSVALLAALSACGYDCVAAHCNFHLRGEESQRDMRFVSRLAGELGIDLCVKNFDVPEQMRSTGQSVEMACRQLRYDWFVDLLERERARAIAVGHHREDQAETFVLNLLRSSGIAGLTGMACRNGLIVRPMLEMSRAEIERYLAVRGLSFVMDSTNAENDYRRNRIRNVVLPGLEAEFPGAMDAVLATMAHLRDNQSLYDYAVSLLGDKFADTDGARIDVAAMSAGLPPQVARMLLFELLKDKGFNMAQTDNILASTSGTVRFDSGAYTAELSRGTLGVRAADTAAIPVGEIRVSLRQPILKPVRIEVTEHHITEFAPVRDSNVIYLDSGVLDGNPVFTLRHWRRGDTMRPYGMDGSKLVSDIFASARYDASAKRAAWFLTRDNTILWAVGLRASAHFPVTPRTRTYLRLRLLPDV